LHQSLETNEFLRRHNLELLGWIEELENYPNNWRRINDIRQQILDINISKVPKPRDSMCGITDENIELRLDLEDYKAQFESMQNLNHNLANELSTVRCIIDQQQNEYELMIEDLKAKYNNYVQHYNRLKISERETSKNAKKSIENLTLNLSKTEKAKDILDRKLVKVKEENNNLKNEIKCLTEKCKQKEDQQNQLNLTCADYIKLKEEYNKIIKQASKMGDLICQNTMLLDNVQCLTKLNDEFAEKLKKVRIQNIADENRPVNSWRK
jgi:chromosome segregation ATPase